MKWWKHFKTVTYHKYLVMKGCFSVGLYWQGICHDFSKYSYTEFSVGAKYYQGNRSPNNAEREVLGYSTSWMHHKGRNKHHYEYWLDYSLNDKKGGVAPVPMPTKYIVEMLMDRIAACKVYETHYTDSSPLNYYLKGKEKIPLHEKTKFMLEFLLNLLDYKGEKETFYFVKHTILKRAKELDCSDAWKDLDKDL